MWKVSRRTLGLLIAVFAQSTPLWAKNFYFDFDAGVSQIRSGSALFGSPSPNSSSYGFEQGATLMANFGSDHSAIELQLGLTNRFTMVSDTNGSFIFAAPYPLVRVQMSRIFIGAGITPFGLVTPVQRASAYLHPAFSYTYLVEAGLLVPITPLFSLGVAGSGQFVNSAGTMGPNPIIGATGFMRFHLGNFGSSGSNESSNEWMGWRYPFGSIR
jgi:hypothetical protein